VTDCAKMNELTAKAIAAYLVASFGYVLSQGQLDKRLLLWKIIMIQKTVAGSPIWFLIMARSVTAV